jgi:formamidopyrimidine-DNA glycosylase
MPELPDVEGYRRALANHLPGRSVIAVEVLDSGVLRNLAPRELRQELVGRLFAHPRRLGKWLILPTDGPRLMIHCGMTGRPYFVDAATDGDRFDRLVITTDRGQLRYADLRKLRGVWLAADEDSEQAVIGPQGPDAFGISSADFVAAVQGRRAHLKAALMDQTIVAGLGNMLSDEICWRAQLHPATPVAELTGIEVARLYRQLVLVLRAAVRAGHIPRTSTWLSSRRQYPDPAPCPRCGTTLRRSGIGGRTSLWCPHCQPIPA